MAVTRIPLDFFDKSLIFLQIDLPTETLKEPYRVLEMEIGGCVCVCVYLSITNKNFFYLIKGSNPPFLHFPTYTPLSPLPKSP